MNPGDLASVRYNTASLSSRIHAYSENSFSWGVPTQRPRPQIADVVMIIAAITMKEDGERDADIIYVLTSGTMGWDYHSLYGLEEEETQ